MTVRRKPVQYDVIEGEGHLFFILDGPSLDGGLDRMQVHDGNRIEFVSNCGTALRFGNVHPRLMTVCRTKPCIVASLTREGVTVVGMDGTEALSEPAQWIPEAFYCYIDPRPSSLGELARRPIARLLSGLKMGVVAISPGRGLYGPPLGLASRSSRMIALPGRRRWCSVSSGLLIEGAAIGWTSAGYPANDDIAASVSHAFDPSAETPEPCTGVTWRSQLAYCVSPSEF